MEVILGDEMAMRCRRLGWLSWEMKEGITKVCTTRKAVEKVREKVFTQILC